MAGCWKVLFEVEVVDVPVVGNDDDVAVVVSVDGAEPDVMAMDEAAEDTGETAAIDVLVDPPPPIGEAKAAAVDGLALGGWPFRRSSKAEFLESLVLFPDPPLFPFPVITLSLFPEIIPDEEEVVTSLIWSLVELSGGELMVEICWFDNGCC